MKASKYFLSHRIEYFAFSPITSKEILSLTDGLVSKKLCGYDGIPVHALKLSKCLLQPLISYFINECIYDAFADNVAIAKLVSFLNKENEKFPLTTKQNQQ